MLYLSPDDDYIRIYLLILVRLVVVICFIISETKIAALHIATRIVAVVSYSSRARDDSQT